MKPIGILGGTFDPIHFGHLRSALEVYHLLSLQEIRFIPCRQPVHKNKLHANLIQRLKMLNLALADQTLFKLDTREIDRNTPSYTLETLQSLRNEFTQHPLYLIIGSDSYAEFTRWYHWQAILELAHLILLPRFGHKLVFNDLTTRLLQERQVAELNPKLCGNILLAPTTSLAISSTKIRKLCASGISPRYLLPDVVYSYIQQENIYR